MADQECLPPVTIGGIMITPEIITQLSYFISCFGAQKAKDIIAETCLLLLSLGDNEDVRQIDPSFYVLQNTLYLLLKELSLQKGDVKC
jgi:hypothetical protein